MEIRSVACPPVNPPPSAPPPPQNTNAPEKRKRVRRWHHRGFTGCSTCRRRHVRCDEASPSCKNCTRLGLECDGTQGRMTFKVYGPPPPPAESSSAAAAKKGGKKSAANAGTIDGRVIKKEEEDDADNFDGVVVSPTTMAESKAVKYRFQEPMSPAGFMNTSLECVDGRYYTHFIDQVATLLLIYDNSINNNPFRRHFPEMAHSSQPVASAMQALGALHLANTSQAQSSRNQHFQQAMGKYGEVVKSFRTRYNNPDQNVRLTDFATCLLLSLFEMMDSQNHNWAIHLKGAREIYRILFLPNTDPQKEADRLSETNHPLRQFLVSLLSYLDVAGACNTGEGTVVEGSYWRTHGGGWEYNLGTPSLSADTNESPLLVELRHRWSIMMEIQAAISAFGKAKQQGYVSIEQQDMVYNELLSRLMQWRQAAPDCFQQLGGLDDESLSHYPYPDILEYAGCIEAYEKATNIFLYRVAAAERPDCQPPRPLMDMLSSRILALIRRLAKDVGQLAVLWPLFTAGRETRDEQEQKYVRQTMLELQRFGFKNVEKALEEIEKAWFKQRVFPDGWVDRMQDVRTSILLP